MAKIRHRAHRGENIILRLKNILGKLIIAVICHQEQKLVANSLIIMHGNGRELLPCPCNCNWIRTQSDSFRYITGLGHGLSLIGIWFFTIKCPLVFFRLSEFEFDIPWTFDNTCLHFVLFSHCVRNLR